MDHPSFVVRTHHALFMREDVSCLTEHAREARIARTQRPVADVFQTLRLSAVFTRQSLLRRTQILASFPTVKKKEVSNGPARPKGVPMQIPYCREMISPHFIERVIKTFVTTKNFPDSFS